LKQYYSYSHFQKDLNTLLAEVVSFQPEAIVGVARGGLTIAHCMAEGLEIREVQTLRTELYDKSSKRQEITIDENCSLSGVKRVLVVDDIADSGETLKVVMEHLEKKYPTIEFKSATLFYKKSSVYEPHFWINEAKAWIDFFWESDFNEF